MLELDFTYLCACAKRAAHLTGVDHDDVVGEAYLRICRSEEPVMHKAYVATVCRSVAYDMGKRDKTRRAHSTSLEAIGDTLGASVDEDAKLLAISIQKVVARLKDADRNTLLAYAATLNMREAAALLGLTEVVYKSRLLRARERVRRLLGGMVR